MVEIAQVGILSRICQICNQKIEKRKRNLDVARPGVYLKHRSRSEQCSMTIHHRVTPDGGPSSFYGQVAQNGTFLHNNKKEEEREREKKRFFGGIVAQRQQPMPLLLLLPARCNKHIPLATVRVTTGLVRKCEYIHCSFVATTCSVTLPRRPGTINVIHLAN